MARLSNKRLNLRERGRNAALVRQFKSKWKAKAPFRARVMDDTRTLESWFFSFVGREQPGSKTCILCCQQLSPANMQPVTDQNSDLLQFSKMLESKLWEMSTVEGPSQTQNFPPGEKFNGTELVEKLTLEESLNQRLSLCSQCQSKLSLSVQIRKDFEETECRVRDLQKKLLTELEQLGKGVEQFSNEMESIQEIVKNSQNTCTEFLDAGEVWTKDISKEEESRVKQIVRFREGLLKVAEDLQFFHRTSKNAVHPNQAPPRKVKVRPGPSQSFPPPDLTHQPQPSRPRGRKQKLRNKIDLSSDMVEEDPKEFPQKSANDNYYIKLETEDEDVKMEIYSDEESSNQQQEVNLNSSKNHELPMDIDSDTMESPSGDDDFFEVGVNDNDSNERRNFVFETKRENVKKLPNPNSAQNNEEIYLCSLCPLIKLPMNVNSFKQHLLFHSDNPRKCAKCGTLVPGTPEQMTDHWKHIHNVTDKAEMFFNVMDLRRAKFCRCSVCSEWFSSAAQRNDHAINAHSLMILNAIPCDICGEKHSNEDELKLHEAVAHPEKAKLQCQDCGEKITILKTTGSEEHFAHLTASAANACVGITGVPKLKPCTLCGEICGETSVSVLHIINRHSDVFNVLLGCTLCPKYFKTALEHQKHQRHQHQGQGQLITNPAKIAEYKGKLPIEIIQTTPKVLARCHLCPTPGRPSTDSELQNHLMKVHRVKIKVTEPIAAVPPPMFASESVSGSYKCSECPQLGEMNLDLFAAHIVFHSRRPNKCSECSWYLSSDPVEIKSHWNDHHKNTPSSSSATIALKYTEVPKINLEPDKIWQCSLCSNSKETFSTEAQLDAHEETLHKGVAKPLQCQVCSKKFSGVSNLCLHKALHHPQAVEFSCFFCDASFAETSIEGVEFCNPSKLLDHLHAVHGKTSYCFFNVCQHCGAAFRLSTQLVDHMVKEHNVDATKCFICKICHKGVSTRVALNNHHRRLHLPAEQLTCDTCGFQVKDGRTFVMHKFREHGIIQEGYKALTCGEPGCEFKTLYQWNLRQHKETHLAPESRSRRFSCHVCGKTFTKSAHLKAHLNIHDNAESKPFQCEICGASFAVKNYLYIHNRLTHAGRFFPSTHKKKPSAKKGKSQTAKNTKALTENEKNETKNGKQDSGDKVQPEQSTVTDADTPVNAEMTPNQINQNLSTISYSDNCE